MVPLALPKAELLHAIPVRKEERQGQCGRCLADGRVTL